MILKGSRIYHCKICHFGILIILIRRPLKKNSKCREKLSLNSHYLPKDRLSKRNKIVINDKFPPSRVSSTREDWHHRGSVQSLSRVWLFATPWTTGRQVSLSITDCQSLPKPMSIESVMPSNHLILCHPLPLLPSIFPSIRVFSNESALHIRWPKYWSFSFHIQWTPRTDLL